jgi:SAM-dependent MidA family methyltransferase
MNPIPFEQFMANALHNPVHGYYTRRIKAVGPGGDFTTAPMLSQAPAQAIAAWAAKALRETRCRDLIEIGPGEGTLAASVCKHLPWNLRWRTRLHLIETSTPLAERQKKLLGKRATWHSSTQAALRSCHGNAVIYSNELVDAFPVRRYQKTAAGWQELAVRFDEHKQPHESLLPPAPLPDSSGFLDSHPLGQRIEVHDSYRRYLTDWLPHWKSGRMLTIDYGAPAAEIYHRRPHGTLRGYLFQQRIEGPAIYQNIGRQDLTADVNFTDLQTWSQPWISEQSLTRLNEFLSEFQAQQLSAPHGAGMAFLVLDQKRSTDPIPPTNLLPHDSLS